MSLYDALSKIDTLIERDRARQSAFPGGDRPHLVWPQELELLIGSADVRDLRAAGKLPARREDGRYDLLEIRATVAAMLGVPELDHDVHR